MHSATVKAALGTRSCPSLKHPEKCWEPLRWEYLYLLPGPVGEPQAVGMGFRVAPAAHRECGRGPYCPLSSQPFLQVLGCIYIIYEIWSKGLFHKEPQRWQSTCRPNTPPKMLLSVAASFPLGWWNHSFMFMLIWEIYKYRKENKKTLIIRQL